MGVNVAVTLIADLTNVNANAYCDVAFADAYHENRGFSEDWTAATPDEKANVLIWVTNHFETLQWMGTRDKTLDPGPLRFPRRNLKDRDGNINTTTAELPLDIKRGVCELALFMLKEDRFEGFEVIQADVSQTGPVGERKLKYNKYPAGVYDYIAWYLNSGMSSFQARVKTGL